MDGGAEPPRKMTNRNLRQLAFTPTLGRHPPRPGGAQARLGERERDGFRHSQGTDRCQWDQEAPGTSRMTE